MTNEQLYEKATRAIQELYDGLFADMSVSPHESREILEALAEKIKDFIEVFDALEL